MASTEPSTSATKDDGDDRHVNSSNSSTAAENSEGRTATHTTTTMAMHQEKNDKRSRRVSFAEMTSVHFFDRDDDNETPSEESGAQTSGKSDGGSEGSGVKNLDDSRDDEQVEEDNHRDEGSEDDDDEVVRRSFFRPIESPSPGSNIGSATSNDEDNFFGPVSASFIRPGRLSDSAASDDNHDVTMDSTAFSLHFRSLARSETGVDIKTPTGIHLSFDEKTPTHTTLGSSMVLTEAKKPICKTVVPHASGGSDSSDMSLVEENSRRYQYEMLSPELDKLLVEGKKNLHPAQSSSNINVSKSPKVMESRFLHLKEQGNGLVKLNISKKPESPINLFNNTMMKEIPENNDANGGRSASITSPAHTQSSGLLLSTLSPNQAKSVSDGKNSVEESSKLLMSDESPALSRSALRNLDNSLRKFEFDGFLQHKSGAPSQELRSYTPTTREKQLIMGTLTPTRYSLMVTPPQDQNMKHYRSESSLQKSISKLEKLQASAFSSYQNAKINSSHIPLLEQSQSRHSNSLTDRSYNELNNNQVSGSLIHNEKELSSIPHKGERSTSDNGIEGLSYLENVDHSEESLNLMATGTDNSDQSMELLPRKGSASQLMFPGKRRKDNQWTSKDHTDKVLVSLGASSPPAEVLLDNKGERNGMEILPRFVSSPNKRLGKKLSSPENQGSLSRDLMLHGSPRSRADFSNSRINVSAEESNAFLSTLSDLRLQKNLLECFEQSPSRKELHGSTPNTNFPSSTTEILVYSSTCKRRNEDVVRDRKHGDEDILIQRSPKVQKIGGPDAETMGSYGQVYRGGPMVNRELEKWSDIFSKFLEDAERLRSPAFEKLNLVAIDVMVDILAQLQRSKTFRVLCHHLSFQRTTNSCDWDNGRTLEIRSLLHRIVYEQAKSILMRLKREKLQEKIQQLSAGLRETQVLKSSSLLQGSKKYPRDALADHAHLQPLSVRTKDAKEVPCDKVTAMIKSLEASDKKVLDLIKTLHALCKIKGEPSCADTVMLVNDHLMKRKCCQFIRMDMQMWGVKHLESRNGRHALILKYSDFITQRLMVTVGPLSNIVITNELNDTYISKKFPNMDACIAFGFVFNSESTRKYVGVRSLAQETQVTSSLLSNLLDVIEEVQLAQIELTNFTNACFYSQSAEQLTLQLCFFNFKSGRKLMLKLDISCLKRGVYPSEASPSEFAPEDDVIKNSFPEQTVRKITDAVKNIQEGYTRILRLCRCISHAVQSL